MEPAHIHNNKAPASTRLADQRLLELSRPPLSLAEKRANGSSTDWELLHSHTTPTRFCQLQQELNPSIATKSSAPAKPTNNIEPFRGVDDWATSIQRYPQMVHTSSPRHHGWFYGQYRRHATDRKRRWPAARSREQPIYPAIPHRVGLARQQSERQQLCISQCSGISLHPVRAGH